MNLMQQDQHQLRNFLSKLHDVISSRGRFIFSFLCDLGHPHNDFPLSVLAPVWVGHQGHGYSELRKTGCCGRQRAWLLILALRLPGCVAWTHSPNLSEPQKPHFLHENSAVMLELSWPCAPW